MPRLQVIEGEEDQLDRKFVASSRRALIDDVSSMIMFIFMLVLHSVCLSADSVVEDELSNIISHVNYVR